jgi:type IV pilus assembly protein PilB
LRTLQQVLVDLGFVTLQDLTLARAAAQRDGRAWEASLLASGKLTPAMWAHALAAYMDTSVVDNNSARVDARAVALVPEATALRHRVMPLRVDDRTLVVAMADPRQLLAIDDLRLLSRREVQPVVATPETIRVLIERHYRENPDLDALAQAMLAEVESASEGAPGEIESVSLDDNALVRVVNNIIREAIAGDMSDIHIEPRPENVLVRVRKDGALRSFMTMPKATASALVARIKIMGGLDIAERRLPQDGRIRYRDRSTEVDMRLSTLPTVYGEKAVMRLLKRATAIPEVEALGFLPENYGRFIELIAKPYGMFLITGPTGSGKSFTTFSILKRVATPEVNVITIEDPVEYEVPGINQTQVNPKAGLDFAHALRSFLRQDPDIIMVGEIRDHETAKIALEAALTGHLLIATLHTNDAASAVVRLTEMGIEPFNVSASLIGVLAQRLVRRICRDCQVESPPDPVVLEKLGIDAQALAGRTLYRGVGCEKCGGTGYNGRYAIHELLAVDDEISSAIVRERSALELKQLAIARGMRTLREDGIQKALDGITTLEEVLARTME